MKLVSTILSCHKVNKQLYNSINSILKQTYTKYELIVVFDNPNQKDFEKIKSKYKNHKLRYKIFFYHNSINKGLTYSLNKGIKLSKGEYIMRQDSDDISKKNRMETLVNYLNNNINKNLVFSNVIIINDSNNILRYKKNYLIINRYFSSYNYRNSISHPSIMFRKSNFNKIKYYDLRFKVSQDYDLIHRFIKDSRNSIGKVNKYLYHLRYSKNSISHKYSKEQLINSVVIIFMYNFKSIQLLTNKVNSTKELFFIIEKNMKTNKQFSIYYSYLFFKKIPYKLLINPIFLINISIRYMFHPNLLIKRIFRLI